MKKYALLLVLFVALFATPNATYAGFIVKRKAESTSIASTTTDKAERQERRQEAVNTILSLMPHEGDDECKGCNRHDGWRGTASMWCAIGGFFYFPPALILALVWGAMGMKPGAKHRKRAMAGVIIAVAGLFFWHLLMVVSLWGI